MQNKENIMIPDIKKILFASDLSENSRHAFNYAASIASRYGADMVFLHVIQDVPLQAKGFLERDVLERIRKQAADNARNSLVGKRGDIAMLETELNRFCNTAMGDQIPTGRSRPVREVVVLEGNLIETIITTAKEMNCDTIVMGSHRRGALSEAVSGSIVRGVLRQSRSLVIVAPPLE